MLVIDYRELASLSDCTVRLNFKTFGHRMRLSSHRVIMKEEKKVK